MFKKKKRRETLTLQFLSKVHFEGVKSNFDLFCEGIGMLQNLLLGVNQSPMKITIKRILITQLSRDRI